MRSLLWVLFFLVACDDPLVTPDASTPRPDLRRSSGDATIVDQGLARDAAGQDSAVDVDSGRPGDAATFDAAPLDAQPTDSGAPDARPADSGANRCPHCVGDAVTWGFTGGRTALRRTAAVQPCRTFTLTEEDLRTQTSTSCSSEIACVEPGEISMDDLTDALTDADVIAAFQLSPITYGRDLRPVDLPIFSVQQSQSTFLVGRPCEGNPGCNPIPPGVQRLTMVLETLQTQQLTRGNCPTVFP